MGPAGDTTPASQLHGAYDNQYLLRLVSQEGKPGIFAFETCLHHQGAVLQGAHEQGWHFSIPAIAPRHQGFQRMLMELATEQILTETDSPYLSQIRGLRNDPRQVVYAIATLVRLRKLTMAQAAQLVWDNFQRLFAIA